MHFRTFVVSALVTASLAAPERLEKRQTASSSPSEESMSEEPNYLDAAMASLAGVSPTNSAALNSLESVLSDMESVVTEPASSIMEALATGIPRSVVEEYMTNPGEILAQLAATSVQVPDWVSALPTEAASYVASQIGHFNSVLTKNGLTHTSAFADAVSSIQSELSEDGDMTTSSTLALVTGDSSASNSTLMTTSTSKSAKTSGTKSTTAATETTGTARASTSSGGPARVTSNPAARPTGALAASLAGLVGVLGVAVAL